MNLVEFLYRALDAQLGIVVRTSNPELARQKLYAARRSATDPALQSLSFIQSRTQPASEIWIVKKATDQKDPA